MKFLYSYVTIHISLQSVSEDQLKSVLFDQYKFATLYYGDVLCHELIKF